MRYLVTGAAGFIGSKVSEFLLDGGHEVVGIDNLVDTYDVRLKEWRLAQLESRDNFTWLHLDIRRREDVARAWQCSRDGFDAVINLAARAGVRQSLEDPWAFLETNAAGTLNLLEQCKDTGVKKFVLASTSSLYGAESPQPFREESPTERPISPYAASKKAAEVLCYTYHNAFGLDITIPRYFTVYGPAGRPDMSLFRFVQWIDTGRPVIVFGDGQQSRDFTYVDDIARGTIAALKPVGYEIVNLGSDTPVVLMDTIRQVEALLGKKANLEFRPAHPADVPATWACIDKARRLLDWEPKTSFEDGVKALVDWYLANQDWAREIRTGE